MDLRMLLKADLHSFGDDLCAILSAAKKTQEIIEVIRDAEIDSEEMDRVWNAFQKRKEELEKLRLKSVSRELTKGRVEVVEESCSCDMTRLM